ncbi:hypothetical protein CBR_g42170 [Chara braunii]|uniref:Uncharacterized protein n=1 Tax=Chara braunii TaxID=69332 RepID=A0A388LX45_CHABU|nr:hypothetical protein CBR_g42170 [Chara braunii]|eukprot:GBG86886.1 hypothetical protein CBR_g42170 [Chara braunii]
MNQTDLNASLASPTLSSVVSDLLGHQGSHPSNTVSMKTPPKSNNSSSPPANKISRSEKEAPTMPTVASTMAKGTGNVSDSSHTLVASAPSSMPFRATLADGTVVLRPFSGSPPIRTQSSRCGDTNNLRRSHAICGGAQAQAQGQEGVAAAAFASQPAAAVLSFHVGNDGQQLSVKVEPFEEGPPAALHPPPTAHRSLVAASEVHNLESVGRRQSETACIPHLQEKRVNRKERHFSLGPWSRINELTVTSEGIRLLGDFIVMPTPLEH